MKSHPPAPSRRPEVRPRGFTLIEMLMVIAIFGLMLGLAIPFFQGIAQGTKLEGSTTELRNTLLLARQYAITRRERIYVLFPDSDAMVFGGGVSNAAYRAYALCTTNEFLREWSFLPEGVYFDRDYPTSASSNNLFTHADYRVALPLWTGGAQPALVFLPNGSLALRTRHPEVALGEGSKLPGGSPLLGPTRNKVQVYGFTGMPQMMRLQDDR